MKISKIIVCFLLLIISTSLLSQNISIGERHSLTSKFLNEERSYQIYFPPSYFSHTKATFPVLYILDGDYNFHYDSGLVEFLSNAAFTIPEMIVVGISDKGGEQQMRNSDPKKNADAFINFIHSELKPHINKTYRTSTLNILAGHSKFGILATHYWMTKPNDFNIFLAIDPSYWFNDYEIVKRLESDLKNGFSPTSKLIIAQATQNVMGIEDLVKVLNTNLPNSNNWNLNQYLNDNHGSLHLKAITDALNNAFKGWEVNRDTFYSFKNANDVVNHYKKLKDKYKTEFILPWYTMSNVVEFYTRKNQIDNLKLLEEGIRTHFPNSLEDFYIFSANNDIENNKIDTAKNLFESCLATNLNSYKALEGLAKIELFKKNTQQAKTYILKAIETAKRNNIRQFYINELQAFLNKIN